MQSVNDTLAERAETHGDFAAKAAFIQMVKDFIRMTPNWKGGELTCPQQESLDLIATKLGRILYGDPHETDHWLDGAGYFTLGAGWEPTKEAE